MRWLRRIKVTRPVPFIVSPGDVERGMAAHRRLDSGKME